MLALVAPLIAGICIAWQLPIDFGRWNLAAGAIGFSSLALVYMGAAFYMPITLMPLPNYGLALAVPLAASLLMWRTGPEYGSSLRDVVSLIVVAAAYGCGLIYVLNGALTRGPATRLVATVTAQELGYGSHPGSYVRLSSTDRRVGERKWRVTRATFSHLPVGSQACVDLFPGALGATWFRVGLCPASPSASIPWAGLSAGRRHLFIPI